jgi:hypothetical protein
MKVLMGAPSDKAHEVVASGLRRAVKEPSSSAAGAGTKADVNVLRERVAALQLLHDMGRLGTPEAATELVALYTSTLYLSAGDTCSWSCCCW